jgi:hypothetical protein
MSKFLISGCAVLASLVLTPVARSADNNGFPSGKHWQFNIIGHPKNVEAISGDDSNGRAIMVPLQNANGPDQPTLACEADGVVLNNDLTPDFTDQEPVGAKIYFVSGDHFEILDRDATDKNGARIMVPTMLSETGETVLAVNVYLRVLGKPLQCMGIEGFAFDELQGLWFSAGQVTLKRRPGASIAVNVDQLFTVNFCQKDVTDADGDGITDECIAGTEQELSVFNNIFSSYFWNILNDGTRLVQVRLVPKTI